MQLPPCARKHVFSNIDHNWPPTRWDCYVIDANGYVIYSWQEEEIGKFFGSLQGGAAMDVLVSEKKFRKIPMFDYQSLADMKKSEPIKSSSSSLISVSLKIDWIQILESIDDAWLVNVIDDKGPDGKE